MIPSTEPAFVVTHPAQRQVVGPTNRSPSLASSQLNEPSYENDEEETLVERPILLPMFNSSVWDTERPKSRAGLTLKGRADIIEFFANLLR